jgi:hypothetical protein
MSESQIEQKWANFLEKVLKAQGSLDQASTHNARLIFYAGALSAFDLTNAKLPRKGETGEVKAYYESLQVLTRELEEFVQTESQSFMSQTGSGNA